MMMRGAIVRAETNGSRRVVSDGSIWHVVDAQACIEPAGKTLLRLSNGEEGVRRMLASTTNVGAGEVLELVDVDTHVVVEMVVLA